MQELRTRHPARFSEPILEAVRGYLPSGAHVLDPFAGTGRVHELRSHGFHTVGVEIESEWANLRSQTIVGNALALPFAEASFDAVVTSPCYGNRFADHHKAKDGSRRRSYRHDLGRPLHPDNSGQLQWGPAYKAFHERAWAEVRRVLKPDGIFVLNVSNHIRAGVVQPVVQWHCAHMYAIGFELSVGRLVKTQRMRYGQNGRARVEGEWVLVFGVGAE